MPTRSFCKRIVFVWLFAGLLSICSSVVASDSGPIKKRDTVTLAVDDNHDGEMDTFQYYVDGVIVRLDKNLDTETGIDMRTYFKDGKKVRQERLDGEGNIYQEMALDTAGKPFEIREDTTADQRMDTVYHIEKGQITRITRDQDGDGATNVLELYRNGELSERRIDTNGDGTVEERLLFDEDGSLARRHLDTDQNGDLDMLEIYRNGLIHMQQWDQNQDERYEKVAFFEKGDIIRVEEDSDMDGIRETAVAYRGGKPFVQTVDANQDGKNELRIFYNAGGETESIERDVSMDGKMDTFQRYKDNRLVFVEKDTNGDGEIDTKISYDTGRQQYALRDQDNDGRFETTHWYDRSPWTRVTELDTDGNGNVDVRSCFMHDIMRRRETLKKGGDLVELRENFDEKGLLVSSLEDRDADGRWDMTWYFDAQGNFQRAEKDADADDRVDTWYYYEGGRLSGVSEDTNGDGRPDIWEDYDASETMTKRKKDLDFDGVADIEEKF
jgi:antitoxin component YwqK of YwqJK toxin-antitoxin module